MSNTQSRCCICSLPVEENAPILVHGVMGIPRLLCSECEKDLDTATSAREPEEIKEAMKRLADKISEASLDELTLNTADSLLKGASERLRAIESGDYDFNEDYPEDDSTEFDDIPEDMRESDDDKALDDKEKHKQEKFDKIFSIVAAVIFALALGFVAYRFISGFFS